MDVSTVSRRLDRLEGELGVHLFDRTREGTVPTAAAEALLPAAEDMERGLAQFGAAVDAIETTAEGVVRVTAPPGVADAFIAPMLPRFHERFPRVSIELDASIGYADLTRRDADIAVRSMRPRSGDLVAVKIVSTRTTLATSPEYAAELGRLKRWDDARWIWYGRELAGLPTMQFIAANVTREPILRTSHFGSQIAAAAAGTGVILVPTPYCLIRRLVSVPLARSLQASIDALPPEELWLVGHRALRTVPRIAAVWEFFAESFADPTRAGELRPG
jgi:DNA-binding transcriptional LysR family regulator